MMRRADPRPTQAVLEQAASRCALFEDAMLERWLIRRLIDKRLPPARCLKLAWRAVTGESSSARVVAVRRSSP